MTGYDLIVIGLGGMGSAIAYNFAKHDVRTLGLERFLLNHTNGSSHGKTRIIRTAYSEHPSYVPLVKRAMELWFQLQKESGLETIKITGGVMVGERESELISGTLESARQHSLPYEVLESNDVKPRFPMFTPNEDEVAIYEKDAGILFPEKCIEAYAQLAKRYGAELRFDEPAIKWSADKNGVVVKTERGSYRARSLIFASGAWTTQFLPELRLPLQCERQIVFWFKPLKNESFLVPERMPIFVWQNRNRKYFYGLPNLGEGVKVAQHHGGQYTTPDAVDRNVTQEDEMPVRGFLESRMPWANGPVLSSTTCIYTNSPDEHFVIDFHPQHRNVIVVSPCSGHGFKFASAIGEAVCEMVLKGKTTHDISLFNIQRFGQVQTSEVSRSS